MLTRRVYSQLNIGESIDELKKTALEQYQALIDGKTDALNALAASLNIRFHRWAHDAANLTLKWQDPVKNVNINAPTAQVKASEGEFEGALPRFGHGLQRAFIFAILQELAEHGDTGPKLLLGCEEPELYQHPPHARYLAGVMQQLSTQNAQVIVSTHSPTFVTGRSFENIRMTLKNPATGAASIKRATCTGIAQSIANVTAAPVAKPGGIAAKIEQELQGPMNEMFFATVRVLVEGIEDIAYISSYLTFMDRWQVFRSYGCHLVEVEGKSHLIEAIAIAKALELPTFVVFDCDGDTPPDTREKPTGRRKKQEADNKGIFSIMGAPGTASFPADVVWRDDLVAWPTKIGDIVASEIGKEELTKLKDQVRAEQGIDLPNMDKNSLFIGYLMAAAWQQGKRSKTLEALCEHIIRFAAPPAPQEQPEPVPVLVGA